jgi:dTDP-4-amino-4,6-dideoxygalactose transaminase
MSEPARIPLSEPCLGGNAQRYLEQCLETNFVSSVGPFVRRFESEFAGFVGARHAVACASGTAAIHVAMRVLGVTDADEVMAPTLTFIASVNPVLYERARPVLVDSERETWNLDPVLVAAELDRRSRAGQPLPRAVEVVHLFGQPARIDALAEACERHGVALLEDASEALGARYVTGRFAGRQVGTIGRLGCFSFNGNKIITTGGGGMIVTDDAALAERARHLTTQARIPGDEYWHDEVGYNYRLTNVAAALGVSQLEQLPRFLDRKREIAARYDAAFGAEEGLALPPDPAWCARSAWLYTVRVLPGFGCDRPALLAHLRESAVESRAIWPPLHRMPVYAGVPLLGGGDVAVSLYEQAVSLPCSVGLTDAQQDRVIDAVRRARDLSRGAGALSARVP